MGLIFKISLRNLLRQKRRNILLGIAIAFGMMILVLANSFSRGLSDMIFNKMLVYSMGHINVSVIEGGKSREGIIRDKDRFISIITNNAKNVLQVNQLIAMYTRVIGNGRADMMAIVGMPMSNGIEYLKGEVKTGNIYDFTNKNIENPIIVYENKAKDLNVKVGDYLNSRTTTINGQVQTARFTLVAIMKSANLMQSMAAYTPQDNQKLILGYRKYESGPLQVVFRKMENPKIAVTEADKIHKALKPQLALIYGNAVKGGISIQATTLSYFTNTNAMTIISNNIKPVSGSIVQATNGSNVMMSLGLAEKLNLKAGDKFEDIYRNRFDGIMTTNSYIVACIFNPGKILGQDVILVPEQNFYPGYYQNLPPVASTYTNAEIPLASSVLYPALATEWKLLPRTKTSDEYQKKIQKVTKEKWEGAYVDVSSMYEIASFILQLEAALNMISIIAVIILFFIILIGVVNTLRMTVRERTREIGTIRAIGMQRKDVRNTFIMETFLLTLLASIAGIITGFIIMGLFSFWKIETDSIFSIFLINKHLNFVPKFTSILSYLIVILLIGVMTAFFPARKAAKMSSAEALRHYE